MKEWFTVTEALAVGGAALPASEKGVALMIEREGWRAQPGMARRRDARGGGFEFHLSRWPAEVQARLIALSTAPPEQQAEARSHALWARFERLPDRVKQQARARLDAVDRVGLLGPGMARRCAVALVASEAKISPSSLWNWLRAADAVHRSDRLPALAPRHQGRTKTSDCDPDAWEFIKADYLRREEPAFETCYRRLVEEAAPAKGWSPIPSERTLRRRLEREIPRAVQVWEREGRDAAARTFPHQTRDRSAFRAMEAVNADGHTFDVFVRWESGEIGRACLLAIQDLYSGMIVGHRLDRSENWNAVRLAFADAVSSFGIPEQCWLDNGRAFASKKITGGMANRYRFKVQEDEPQGVLTALGITVRWVTPYHGQAKPIERAFRDLCETIARHPFCAGAYTGNSPSAKPENYGAKALPIEQFETFVAQQIVRHNLRTGRRATNARGRSFEATFRESYAHPLTLVKKAGAGQLRQLLLAAEERTCRAPDGSVYLGDNRYWSEELVEHAGRRVVIRFDPQSLFLPAAIYTRDGRFIGDAECVERTGFADIDAARAHAKRKQTYLRKLREVRDMEIAMSVGDLAKLLPPPETPQPPRPGVVRLVAGGGAPRPIAVEPEPAPWAGAESFGRVARMLEAGAVLPFRKEAGDSA